LIEVEVWDWEVVRGREGGGWVEDGSEVEGQTIPKAALSDEQPTLAAASPLSGTADY
jgi:hypothetical protein